MTKKTYKGMQKNFIFQIFQYIFINKLLTSFWDWSNDKNPITF